MVRTQVQLTERQLDTLRELSTATGRSVAELVRLGVELYLSSQHRPSRKSRLTVPSGRSANSLRAVTMSAFTMTVTWPRLSWNDCLRRYFGVLRGTRPGRYQPQAGEERMDAPARRRRQASDQ